MSRSTMVFVAAVLTALLDAFVLKVLWVWYAMPIFKLPALSFAAALGLTMLLSVATRRRPPMLDIAMITDPRTSDEEFYRYLSLMPLAPAWVFFVGWVAHFFMKI